MDVTSARELSWDGCVNVRDLGGLGRVRPGAVVRMEAPTRLSDAGWAAAVHGAHATCYWVAVDADGRTRYGTGSACTGMSALAADRPAW